MLARMDIGLYIDNGSVVKSQVGRRSWNRIANNQHRYVLALSGDATDDELLEKYFAGEELTEAEKKILSGAIKVPEK